MPYKECFVRVLVLNEIEKFIQKVLLSFVHDCNKTAYFSLPPPDFLSWEQADRLFLLKRSLLERLWV